MPRQRRSRCAVFASVCACAAALVVSAAGQQGEFAVQAKPPVEGAPPARLMPPIPAADDRPLPITLPAALRLANANPLDIAAAAERIRLAAAQLKRSRVLWLPSVSLGVDYFRHDGQLQDVAGEVFGTSKSTFQVGAGPSAVFALADAVYAPLAARQVVRARQADHQAATNDSLLAVAEAYISVQEARGTLAGAEDAARRAVELVRRAEGLAPELTPPVEASRARTELARRRQAVHAARAHWRTASAELNRLLRLDPAALVEPVEPPQMLLPLLDLETSVDELIPVGLTNRPELAAQQALVQGTLEQLRQERLRPLVPSVLLRGAATNPSGTLAGAYFGGGRNGNLSKFAARGDFDVQVLWEWQNLGLGNHARVKERQAEHRLSLIELFRIQDRVAAEVAQQHALARAAADRQREAEAGLKDAVDSADKNFEGMRQTKRVGNLNLLVIRPAEATAAVQALAQAYADYYGAVGDFNRAQFRLYRAMGHPAQSVMGQLGDCAEPGTAKP